MACLTLALSCTPDETLEVSPEETSVSIPQGGSGTFSLSFELPTRRNLQTVTLPATVTVFGEQSEIPPGLRIIVTSSSVTIAERGTSVPVTITVEVEPETALGDYVIHVRPSSTAKHLDTGSGARVTVNVVQGEAPLVKITSPQDGFAGGDTLTITGTITDPQNDLDSWEIRLDGNSLKTGQENDPVTVDADISGFDDGSEHTVEITATDTAGHTGKATEKFTIERGAPEVTLTEPADGTVTSGAGPLHIAGTVSDPEDNFKSFSLKLGDDELATGTAPGEVIFDLDATALAEGPHTISLTATDLAGNETTQSAAIAVDRSAPTPTITVPQSGQLYLNDNDLGPRPGGGNALVIGQITATVTLPNETLGTGGTLADCPGPECGVVFILNDVPSPPTSMTAVNGVPTAKRTYSSVPSGANTLEVQVVDKLGNDGQASTTFDGGLLVLP